MRGTSQGNPENVVLANGNIQLIGPGDTTVRTIKPGLHQPGVGDPDPAEGVQIKEITSLNASGGINLVLPVKINGVTVEAILDTGAQITVISEELAKKARLPSRSGEPVYLKGVQDSVVRARSGGKARVAIGKTETKWHLIVAKITDDIIIGLDLLYHLKVVIDLAEYTVQIGAERLLASCIKIGEQRSKIRKVQLQEKMVITPKSTVQFRLN